ncbi:MAG: methylmalonyl-CoA mutase subunit beta [Flavobacteriaceae bacterium]
MSEQSLFEMFPPVNSKGWKQKIQADLKGADYNKTLVWESAEGIKVKPFYSSEDLEGLTPSSELNPSSWKVGQRIEAQDFEDLKKQCINAFKGGAEHLILHLDSNEVFLDSLISEPLLKGCKFLIEANHRAPDTMSGMLKSSVESPHNIFLYDIIGHLAGTGNWHSSYREDFETLETLISDFPKMKLVAVNGALYQNSGANKIQELAYMVAHAKAYLDHLQTDDFGHITFKTSTGSNYFFEIAKLKALRQLFQKLMEEEQRSLSYHIISSPSERNKSIYDYNVNMLRSTTECMAAILGGADTIYNLPYDNMYHGQNEFADRIARNQLLILKHESYFDQVSNAAAGSYYIESLSEEMVEKAWAIYKQIEAGGGFLTQLKEHKIQKKIKESANSQQQAFNDGHEVLVGCNKYPNEADKMKDQLDKDPFMQKVSRKTLIEPIIEKRLAEPLEKNRLDHE